MKGRNTGRVYVAMSGGVDSSVAALLLVRQGYDVVGVFMKPWQPRGFSCLWHEDRADALRVAAHLDIPLETWDFSRQYERFVTRPMIAGYRSGVTPNPDVECNREIKFGLFYDRARARGADWIATGHYARIVRRRGSLCLAKGTDADKDQSYFLWGIRSPQLQHILFPVGDLRKPDVRRIATRAHLATALKKDSQGVCFVGDMDVKAFLATRIKPKKGKILHVDGRLLGEHDGAGYYTIGQRHGLDIRVGGGPYYVVRKDMRRNTVTVGGAEDILTTTARMRSPSWIRRPEPSEGGISAKIRYRTPSVPVRIKGSAVRFGRPVSALASGQSIVFYKGDIVLGGAIVR